jgi:hypothetical protein
VEVHREWVLGILAVVVVISAILIIASGDPGGGCGFSLEMIQEGPLGQAWSSSGGT